MSQSGSVIDGMHLLEEIIKDTSRDVGTQTLHTESSKNKTQSGKSAVDDKTASRVDTSRRSVLNSFSTTDETSSKPNYKSSFRLLIVPDADTEEQWSGLRLSLHDLQSNSLRLSVTSSNAESPNALNSKRPIHSGEIRKTKTHETNVKSLEKRKGSKLKSSAVTAEKNDRFMEEHQLIHSLNPSVIAWLRLKNFEERQKRKAKKREKRELKRVEREEEERRKGREEESEKKFAQWLGTKKKEAKRVYRREHRAKTKVSHGEAKRELPNDDDPPPTDYTVVASFNHGAQAMEEGLHTARLDENAVKAKNSISSQGTSLKKQKKVKRPRNTTAVGDRYNTTHEQGSLGKRPNSANARIIVDSGTKQNVVIEGSKRITYVAWMERKRQEDKEKAKQIKREVVDDALAEGILKLARRRAENIRQGKKEVDTGIAKWRTKNRVMNSASEDTSTDTSSTVRSQYVFRANTEEKQTATAGNPKNSSLESQDRIKARGKNAATSGWKEIEMIRKFCENVKLDTSEPGVLAGEPHALEYAVVEETNAITKR